MNLSLSDSLTICSAGKKHEIRGRICPQGGSNSIEGERVRKGKGAREAFLAIMRIVNFLM